MHQDHFRAVPGGHYSEHRLEWSLGLDRDDGVLAGVDVDGVQHRHQQLPSLLEVRSGPQLLQLRDQLSGFGSRIGLWQYQRTKFQLSRPFLPLVLFVVIDAIDVGFA